MKIVHYVNPGMPHHGRYAELFGKGLRQHGLESEVRPVGAGSVECDLAVMWSGRFEQVQKAQRDAGRDYLILERGYFGGREHFVSVGFNGLHGAADKIGRCGSDRWMVHGVAVRKWKTQLDGGYALICGQVGGDANVRGYNLDIVYRRMVAELRENWGDSVRFRPHPLAPVNLLGRSYGIEVSNRSLDEDLSGAAVAISINSNSMVDALLRGVPTIVTDRASVAWSVSKHWIVGPEALCRPNRMPWLNQLAYRQWTEDEIASGAAWEYLRKRYD